MNAHRIVALCRRQHFLAYWFQLSDWVCQGKIPVGGGKKCGRNKSVGGVSNVDIDRNNTLEIKAIGVTISTFETPPIFVPRSIAEISL